MYYATLTDEETKIIGNALKDDAFKKLMFKEFMPELNFETSFSNNVDLWTTISFGEKGMDESVLLIQTRQLFSKYVTEGLSNLLDGKTSFNDITKMDFSTADASYDTLVAIKARAEYIAHVEMRLNVLSIIAGQKTETVEQQKKRLLQNSSK